MTSSLNSTSFHKHLRLNSGSFAVRMGMGQFAPAFRANPARSETKQRSYGTCMSPGLKHSPKGPMS